MAKLKRFLKDTKHGVKNLWRWAPVIWNLTVWDYASIYDILIFQINRMAEAFEGEYAMTRDAKRHAEQMRYVSKNLRKLRDGAFEEAFYDAHKEKWGDLTANYIDDHEFSESFTVLQLEREYAQTEEERDEEARQLIDGLKEAGEMHKELREETFEFLGEIVEEWWD